MRASLSATDKQAALAAAARDYVRRRTREWMSVDELAGLTMEAADALAAAYRERAYREFLAWMPTAH